VNVCGAAVHEATSFIASHMRCRGAKRKLVVRNFWRPYIALCVDTYCVLYTCEIYRYVAIIRVVKHSGRVSGFLTRRI
jgi:hypothetical protein